MRTKNNKFDLKQFNVYKPMFVREYKTCKHVYFMLVGSTTTLFVLSLWLISKFEFCLWVKLFCEKCMFLLLHVFFVFFFPFNCLSRQTCVTSPNVLMWNHVQCQQLLTVLLWHSVFPDLLTLRIHSTSPTKAVWTWTPEKVIVLKCLFF